MLGTYHISIFSSEHPETLRTVWSITDFSERALFYATNVAYRLEFVKESVRWVVSYFSVAPTFRSASAGLNRLRKKASDLSF